MQGDHGYIVLQRGIGKVSVVQRLHGALILGYYTKCKSFLAVIQKAAKLQHFEDVPRIIFGLLASVQRLSEGAALDLS